MRERDTHTRKPHISFELEDNPARDDKDDNVNATMLTRKSERNRGCDDVAAPTTREEEE